MKKESSEEKTALGEESFSSMMDLFVGNLSLYTTEAKLQTYFSSFGNVSSVKICTHPENGKNKRFGFLNFEDEAVISKILNYGRHIIDGKTLEIRYASKNSKPPRRSEVVKSEDTSGVKGVGENLSNAKVFVGGVSQNANVEDLKAYFSSYGPVAHVSLLPDHITGRHRGFGFVTFQNDSTADVVTASRYHTIKMKKVECKKASLTRSPKAPDRKNPGAASPPSYIRHPYYDPSNKSPGILGEHPWQVAPGGGGFLLNPQQAYAATLCPSFSFAAAAAPTIYLDHTPLYPAPSTPNHAHFKLLSHRFISDSALRYSPYNPAPPPAAHGSTVGGGLLSSSGAYPASASATTGATGGFCPPAMMQPKEEDEKEPPAEWAYIPPPPSRKV